MSAQGTLRREPMPENAALLAVADGARELELLGTVLFGLPCEPVLARTLDAARDLAGARDFAAAVILLPAGVDPLGAVEALRASPHSRQLPILLLAPPELSFEGLVLPGNVAVLRGRTAPERIREALAHLLDLRLEARTGEGGSGEFFRGLLAQLRGCLVIAESATDRILEWSPRAAALFGLDAAEVLGRPLDEVLEPLLGTPDLPMSPPFIGPDSSFRERLLRRPGLPKGYLLSNGWEGELDGERVRAQVFFDVTPLRAHERQMGIAQRLESIGRLAAGIAHEINTPIQYIGDNIRFLGQSYASMAAVLRVFRQCLEGVRHGEDPADHVERIEEAVKVADLDFLEAEIPSAISQSLEGVNRVAAIVRSMKKFSHPDTEGDKHLDLNQALQDALLVARNEWKYVAELTMDLDPGLPLVRCLPGDVNQAFLNIIVNAAQAVEDCRRERGGKGNITVTSRRKGDMAEIRISDDGVGIPADCQAHIFDPFFTTKEAGRGTGQGLAIAQAIIVDKHGGALSFESEAGKGTTFIIRLPLSGLPGRCEEDR